MEKNNKKKKENEGNITANPAVNPLIFSLCLFLFTFSLFVIIFLLFLPGLHRQHISYLVNKSVTAHSSDEIPQIVPMQFQISVKINHYDMGATIH